MRRFKIYVSLCLMMCMLISACPAVFADYTPSNPLISTSGNSFIPIIPELAGYGYPYTSDYAYTDDYVYVSAPSPYGAEYGLAFLMNPAENVTGSVYTSLPYGFIIHDYAAATSAFVSDTGVHIPSGTRNFNHIDANGLIEYYEYAGNIRYGIMDIHGNDIIPAGIYNTAKVLSANRFVCSKFVGQKEVFGIVDGSGNVIVPFEYSHMDSMGTVVATSMDGSTKSVFDSNGDLVITYSQNEAVIQPIPSNDRYLYITGDAYPKVTIKNIDGSNVHVLDSFEHFAITRDSTKIRGYKKFPNGTKHYCEYNFNGTLTHMEDEMNNVVFDSPDYDPYASKYEIVYNGIYDGIIDETEKLIYINPDVNILEIYKDKFIKVSHKIDGSLAVLDLAGNEIIPYGLYSKITYNRELGIFALEKENRISIGKIKPITVKVNGVDVEFDQFPVIKNNRTLVPLRAIFEALGAAIDWNNATQTVTATHGITTVKLTIGSDIMTINGNQIQLDVPAEALNGRTLVPVRAISEAFGCSVVWDQNARCVVIDETTYVPTTEPTPETEEIVEVEDIIEDKPEVEEVIEGETEVEEVPESDAESEEVEEEPSENAEAEEDEAESEVEQETDEAAVEMEEELEKAE